MCIFDDIEQAQVARLTKAGPVYEVTHFGSADDNEDPITMELYHGSDLKYSFPKKVLDQSVSCGARVWELPVSNQVVHFLIL